MPNLDEFLEAIAQLPIEEQKRLLEFLQMRLIEPRRGHIAQDAAGSHTLVSELEDAWEALDELELRIGEVWLAGIAAVDALSDSRDW